MSALSECRASLISSIMCKYGLEIGSILVMDMEALKDFLEGEYGGDLAPRGKENEPIKRHEVATLVRRAVRPSPLFKVVKGSNKNEYVVYFMDSGERLLKVDEMEYDEIF